MPTLVLALPLFFSTQDVEDFLHLGEILEINRIEHQIPGMAVAVVRGDELVYAQGFGVQATGDTRAVDTETLFGIGSATKAFTATLVCMLEEEGKLEWDDPVIKHLPFFEIPIDAPLGMQATLRDLACHRTGFPRMGPLWAGGKLNSKDILTAATNAEPYSPFRQEFHYNNLMYLALGEATAIASEQSWKGSMQERIIDPLGMKRVFFDWNSATKDPNLAAPHRLPADGSAAVPSEEMHVDSVAPAGSIISNVEDMSRWLMFQLGQGTIEDELLVSKGQIEETWTPQIGMGPLSYGLGWMVDSFRGQRHIHHGGNTGGYATMVSMLPDSEWGLVFLSNVAITPLQGKVAAIVWAHLLDAGKTDSAPKEEEDLDLYVGNFIADFAVWDQAVFTVTNKEGVLHLDVPGQMNYELRPPGEDGLREFAITDQVKVGFTTDESGKVIQLDMYQGGVRFECFLEGYVVPWEFPREEIEPLLGTYFNERENLTWTVLIQNNRLAVDIPGEMIYDLFPPDEEGWRTMRALEICHFKFDLDSASGKASFDFKRNSNQLEFSRVAAADPVTETTLLVEELTTLYQDDARSKTLSNVDTLLFDFDLAMPHAGIDGTIRSEWTSSHTGTIRTLFGENGKFGKVLLSVQESQGRLESDFEENRKLTQREMEELSFPSPWTLVSPISDYQERILKTERMDFEGHSCWVISLDVAQSEPFKMWIDTNDGRVRRFDTTMSVGPNMSFPIQQIVLDWNSDQGFLIPSSLQIITPESGDSFLTLERIQMLD
ncbi:MAG: beta-lactamase family protein [Planctomycetes bacterium]|nr:beta-lactamase family protein [Planctomycetota bacterium]